MQKIKNKKKKFDLEKTYFSLWEQILEENENANVL